MAILGTTDIHPSQRKKELTELTEVPNKIRFLVEASPNINSKVATLQKFYDDVQVLEGNNFIVTDRDGNRFQLDNKNKILEKTGYDQVFVNDNTIDNSNYADYNSIKDAVYSKLRGMGSNNV